MFNLRTSGELRSYPINTKELSGVTEVTELRDCDKVTGVTKLNAT